MNLRTDTEAEQWRHYPTAMARRDGDPWPTRAEWAEQVRVVNDITVNDVRERVSHLAEDYATAEEIATAVAELRAQWKATGRDVRAANAAARAVWPLYDKKSRRDAEVSHASWYDAWDELSPDDQSTVSRAQRLTRGRKELHELMRSLERGFLNVMRIEISAVLSPGTCPTFDEIHRRWEAAQDAVAAEYVRRVENHPIDDEAWAKELRSRENLERYFRDGPIVRRIPAG